MNDRVESNRSRLGRMRELGNRITGGGLRALLKRAQHTGDHLTGGGLR